MTREERIRAICAKHDLAGLGVIATNDGLSPETTERLAVYINLLVEAVSRNAATVAAGLLAQERAADHNPARSKAGH